MAKISHGVFIDLAPSCRCERRDFLRIPTIGVDLELGEARRTPIRPSATLGALIALLALFTASGAGEVDRRRLDHIAPGLWAVRPHPSTVQDEDRHRRARRGKNAIAG